MTFGTGEVQGKPATPLLGLRRRKKKKKRVEEKEESKITPTVAADVVSNQEAGKGDFDSFKHNSPSRPESEGNLMQGYEKKAAKDQSMM